MCSFSNQEVVLLWEGFLLRKLSEKVIINECELLKSFAQKKDTISMQTFLMWETKDILEMLYYHSNLVPIILIQSWFL